MIFFRNTVFSLLLKKYCNLAILLHLITLLVHPVYFSDFKNCLKMEKNYMLVRLSYNLFHLTLKTKKIWFFWWNVVYSLLLKKYSKLAIFLHLITLLVHPIYFSDFIKLFNNGKIYILEGFFDNLFFFMIKNKEIMICFVKCSILTIIKEI